MIFVGGHHTNRDLGKNIEWGYTSEVQRFHIDDDGRPHWHKLDNFVKSAVRMTVVHDGKYIYSFGGEEPRGVFIPKVYRMEPYAAGKWAHFADLTVGGAYFSPVVLIYNMEDNSVETND